MTARTAHRSRRRCRRRVVNLVSVDPTALVVWLAGLATDWQQRRRHVRVMVHRAFFQVPDAPECFFKVTNLSSSREIEVTHIWFATEPRVDVLNQERRLPARLRHCGSCGGRCAPAASSCSFELVRAGDAGTAGCRTG